MNKLLFVLGLILDVSGGGLSFYPVFQDFNETDYVIPFYKNEDYPNQIDLLILNVLSDCNMSDNVFSQFSMNDELMCTSAQNWFYSLVIMISSGITLMIAGAVYPQKKNSL